MIVGLGKTGLSCARFLRERSIPFLVVDSRPTPPGLARFTEEFPGVLCELGPFRDSTFCNAAELIVSPGVSLREKAIQRAIDQGVPVTGDIDMFSRLASKPIVAVTGSNGKSTVVTLVAEILRGAGLKVGLGGNLDGDNARPALDLLRAGQPQPDIYVLELSSFQLETTRELGAEVAVLLNLSEDHMDRYEDLKEYLQAKQRIFRRARKVVINRDCPFSQPPLGSDPEMVEFGLEAPGQQGFGLLEQGGESFLGFGSRPLLRATELKIFGRHNVANALAAMAICYALDVEMNAIVEGVRKFQGLPNRCQWIANIDGTDFYNDSKGTNVGATVAAIDGLGRTVSGKVVLIAGGVGKGADFYPLRNVVERFVNTVILIGEAAGQIAAKLDGAARIMRATSLENAVVMAADEARPGDAVLLSPACASFDMFTDFNHRGQVFVAAVRRLQ